MNSKKRNIIIAVVAVVIAVVIAVVTVVLVMSDRNGTEIIPGGSSSSSTTKAKVTVNYDPEDYEDYICGNCEVKIEGKSYYPSDDFMVFVTQDLEKEDIAICEDCAKELYKDELAAGKSLDEFIRK